MLKIILSLKKLDLYILMMSILRHIIPKTRFIGHLLYTIKKNIL